MATRMIKSPLLWLMALSAATYQSLIVPQWSRLPVWDSAYYVCLARSLAQGRGYIYMGWPHGKYPPGVPLLLAPIEWICGDSFLLMRALMVSCALGVILMTWLLMRRLTSPPLAFAVSVMTAASYGLFQESAAILSDVPYTFISLAALYAAERLRCDLTRRRLYAAIMLMLAAYLTRVIGFTLAPAIALALLIDSRGSPRSRRLLYAGWIIGAMALAMACWMGYSAWAVRRMPLDLRSGSSYEREFIRVDPNNPDAVNAQLAELGRRVNKNFTYYRVMLTDLLTAKSVENTKGRWALSVWCLAGWLIVLVRRRSAAAYYTFLYLGVLLLWPTQQGKRFLVPLLPMFFYYALEPLRLMWKKPVVLWLLLGALVIASLFANARLIIPFVRAEHGTPYHDPETAEFIQALDWVREHTPPDAVLITDRSPMAYALTGRRAFTFPWVPDQAEVLDFMQRRGATHVIANPIGFAPQYLLPVIRAHPDRFREIQRFGENVVYDFIPQSQ